MSTPVFLRDPAAFFVWLRDHGFGFGTGEALRAAALLDHLDLAIHQFSRAAQRGGSGRQDRTILTMRRRPLVNQEVRLRATFLG
jgi:hypothetical protein